jgi:hypothetical protein
MVHAVNLVILPDPDVTVALYSVVKGRHLGYFGSERAGYICQRMEKYIVYGAYEELSCKMSE